MGTPQVPLPETSVTDLVTLALGKAREIAAQEHGPITGAAEAHIRAERSGAQRHVEILQAALLALTDQACEAERLPDPAGPILDAEGFDLRPDPLTARTSAELVACLRSYRAWSGQPSLRKIATQAGHAASHAAIRAVLNSDSMPGLPKVVAIVAGCGGSREDQQSFATAWRRITMNKPAGEPTQSPAVHTTTDGTPAGSRHDGRADTHTDRADAGQADADGQPAFQPQTGPSWSGQATGPTIPLAVLLREYRLAAALTQEELAEAANLSVRSVSDLETAGYENDSWQQPTAVISRLIMFAASLSRCRREQSRCRQLPCPTANLPFPRGFQRAAPEAGQRLPAREELR